MLDVALKNKKVFDELEFRDTKYATELGKIIGLSSYEIGSMLSLFYLFLSIFL